LDKLPEYDKLGKNWYSNWAINLIKSGVVETWNELKERIVKSIKIDSGITIKIRHDE